MSGFLSSSTALTICKVDSAASLDLDALRQHAFTPEIDADGRRFGWVTLAIRWTPMVLNWPPWMPVSWAFPSGWIRARRPGPSSGFSLPKPCGRKSPPAKRWAASARKS